ncbi:glycosyl hydrolase 2 galactose-binding domain-containing protein [Herbiconiux daphne]|uniref:beta-mannosidase n=1 Tax=Herbiconiux daphne TaxID=2970914 RepID=A0ABT2H830_9MICO|nr:sugar-binding domain-containing protein [Herbiconiux daphne]MCS5736028.1 hypothetical protein [Herbiconiux daphne]
MLTSTTRRTLDLAGEWLWRADPHDLGEHYPAQLAYTHAHDARWPEPPAGTTTGWAATAVPGRWPRPEADGDVVWFRRSFDAGDGLANAAAADASLRTVLRFEGVNYLADVWLNGHYLGSHEGYFGAFSFEVTGELRPVNDLVVRVVRATDVLGEEDQMGQFKRDFVGALGRWDMNDPDHKPAGIWGAVTLVRLAAVSVDDWSSAGGPRVDYSVAALSPSTDGDALVEVSGTITATLTAARTAALTAADTAAVMSPPGGVTLAWSIAPSGFDAPAASGSTSVVVHGGRRTATVDFTMPARLWYTWDLGAPRLYDVTLTVTDAAGTVLDDVRWTTGFRSITRGAGWSTELNGLPFYQRGANYLSDLDLSSMTPERYATDVTLLREANLNVAHPFCHVEADAFYAECDRQGIAVYQDFPVWLMADTSGDTVRRALGQFDQLLDRLHEHPGVVIWNLGSQPSEANAEKLCAALVRRATDADPSRIANLGNAAISYEPHDDVHPTRSFFWSRETAERLERRSDWRRDTHMYPGWYFGGLDTIADLPLDDFQLVTEFGGQSLPRRELLERFLDCDAPIDWATIARRCGQPALLQRHNPEAATVDELIESSQRHQSELVRHHVEFIRARKGAPGHGLHLFAFNDCWPSITWSVVDHDRVTKPAYDALRTAMAPVQAFLLDHDDALRPGAQAVTVHVVNDTGRALTDAALQVTLDPGTDAATVLAEHIYATLSPSDVTSTVLDIDLPAAGLHGRHEIELGLEWSNGSTLNRYTLVSRDR